MDCHHSPPPCPGWLRPMIPHQANANTVGRRTLPIQETYGDDLSLAAKQSVFVCLRVITQRSGRLRLSHTTSPRSST